MKTQVKNLFDPALVDDTQARILLLTAENQPYWGTLNASQALVHCALGFEMATGALKTKRAPFPATLFGRVIKPFIFRDNKPMRRNSPSTPELFTGNTAGYHFINERSRLLEGMHRFAARGPAGCTRQPHPFFGPLMPEEWAILMYKHIDHHLRQFGA